MKQECALLVVLITAACASAPDEKAAREYHRESYRIEAVEQLEQFKRACAKAGGVVQVRRQSSGRMPPTASSMRMATCGVWP